MTGPAIMLLRQLLATRTSVATQRTIIDLLARADTVQLNEMLADPVLTDRLLATVGDRWLGPDHHSELVELLVIRRRDELDLPARAALIHALQTGRTGPRDERLICELLCSAQGNELTMLKCLIDATPNHNDLEELVYRDIDDHRLRQRILDHIAEQAARVSGTEAKVLSDIDDTTICSLHDKRFPKGIVYPGAMALWQALDEGPAGQPRTTGDLTFVTARPADLFGWVEDHTRRRLRDSGVKSSSMLTGSLIHLLSHSLMANKKIEAIAHYHELYPEYRLIFIGDSGQGDVLVGQRLRAEYSGMVDAVLIHDVVTTPEEQRIAHQANAISYFDTYPGAALTVFGLGLISLTGLQLVVAATRLGFAEVTWEDPGQQARAEALLQRDLARIERAINRPTENAAR